MWKNDFLKHVVYSEICWLKIDFDHALESQDNNAVTEKPFKFKKEIDEVLEEKTKKLQKVV